MSVGQTDNAVENGAVVSVENHIFAMARQSHLFSTFLFDGCESFAVFVADVGEYRDCRSDNLFKSRHFVGAGDAGLDDGQVGIVVDVPYRQWNADLRIVAPRAAHNIVVVAEQLVEPFFDNGFPSAACNSYHRNVEAPAVVCRKALERSGRILDKYEICVVLQCIFRDVVDYEVAHAFFLQLPDVAMPVVAFRRDGKKQRAFGVGECARVCEKDIDGVGCHFVVVDP